jgi:transposase
LNEKDWTAEIYWTITKVSLFGIINISKEDIFMSNKSYSEEFKLEVIMDYLNNNLGVRETAKKYGLPSKNYITEWKKQLLKKGLITEEAAKRLPPKNHPLKEIPKKTAYEKQLEKENYRLRAELAFYQELKRLVDEDNKKK